MIGSVSSGPTPDDHLTAPDRKKFVGRTSIGLVGGSARRVSANLLSINLYNPITS